MCADLVARAETEAQLADLQESLDGARAELAVKRREEKDSRTREAQLGTQICTVSCAPSAGTRGRRADEASGGLGKARVGDAAFAAAVEYGARESGDAAADAAGCEWWVADAWGFQTLGVLMSVRARRGGSAEGGGAGQGAGRGRLEGCHRGPRGREAQRESSVGGLHPAR